MCLVSAVDMNINVGFDRIIIKACIARKKSTKVFITLH